MSKQLESEYFVKYQEHDLDSVIRYFGKDFSGEVVSYEYWIDTHLRRVIFKLVLKKVKR